MWNENNRALFDRYSKGGNGRVHVCDCLGCREWCGKGNVHV